MKIIYFFIITLIIFFNSCKNETNSTNNNNPVKKANIEIDKSVIPNNCFNDNCVSDQWNIRNIYYSIITGENVNIRSKPNINSQIVGQLSSPEKIKVLYVSKEKVVINKIIGHWAFVISLINKNTQGWIFDRFIGFKSKFKKLNNWHIKELEIGDGDISYKYVFMKNGNYSKIITNHYPEAKVKTQRIKGYTLKYRNTIWFKDNYSDYIEILSLDKNNKLKNNLHEGFLVKYFD